MPDSISRIASTTSGRSASPLDLLEVAPAPDRRGSRDRPGHATELADSLEQRADRRRRRSCPPRSAAPAPTGRPSGRRPRRGAPGARSARPSGPCSRCATRRSRRRAARAGREHVDRPAVRRDARHPAERERARDAEPRRQRRRSRRGPRASAPTAPGRRHDDHVASASPAMSSIDGQRISRVTPSTRWTVGRVCCRSTRSARSIASERPLRLELLGEHRDGAGARHSAVDPPGERDHHHRVASCGHVSIETAGPSGQPYVLSRRVRAVRFGVHTGCSTRRSRSCARCGAASRSSASTGSRSGTTSTRPTQHGDPHCLEAITSHTALAATTTRVRAGSLVYSRRLPPPGGARERDGDARPGRGRPRRARPRRRLAAGRVRRVRHPLPPAPASGCACSSEYIQCVRGLLTQDAHELRRRVLHARATRSASRSRCRRGSRSGSAAAARRSRCASPRSTPTAGTCRSSRPTCGRTRRGCSTSTARRSAAIPPRSSR